jgi:hypothetical protein
MLEEYQDTMLDVQRSLAQLAEELPLASDLEIRQHIERSQPSMNENCWYAEGLEMGNESFFLLSVRIKLIQAAAVSGLWEHPPASS